MCCSRCKQEQSPRKKLRNSHCECKSKLTKLQVVSRETGRDGYEHYRNLGEDGKEKADKTR